jgi:hypothetical protein
MRVGVCVCVCRVVCRTDKWLCNVYIDVDLLLEAQRTVIMVDGASRRVGFGDLHWLERFHAKVTMLEVAATFPEPPITQNTS